MRHWILPLFVFALYFSAPLTGLAQGQSLIPAKNAHQMQAKGAITLIDVRTSGEWKKTGRPQGAAGATIRGRGINQAFLEQVAKITGGDKSKPIAMICASGVRSAYATKLLRAQGYKNVHDVAGGMFGNSRAPGWLKQNLPVESWTGQ